MAFSISRKQRLTAAITISCAFFLAELLVAFETRSLALLADSFHYINDTIGFAVALAATHLSERRQVPRRLPFGWQRASLLGAFFNGVFLLALGLSIFLQSVERFVSLQQIQNPQHVFIMGCVGLALNTLSVLVLHESHFHEIDNGRVRNEHDPEATASATVHRSDLTDDGDDTQLATCSGGAPHVHHRRSVAKPPPGRDLGMLGVMLHVAGDALNNLGVAVAALVIWKTESPARYYADPSVGIFISAVILVTAVPLMHKSGEILLESAPAHVDPEDVRRDLEKIPGIQSIHELRIWRLDQTDTVASVHILVEDEGLCVFMEKARTIDECLRAYGVHTSAIQPEVLPRTAIEQPAPSGSGRAGSSSTLASSGCPETARSACQLQQLGSNSVSCI